MHLQLHPAQRNIGLGCAALASCRRDGLRPVALFLRAHRPQCQCVRSHHLTHLCTCLAAQYLGPSTFGLTNKYTIHTHTRRHPSHDQHSRSHAAPALEAAASSKRLRRLARHYSHPPEKESACACTVCATTFPSSSSAAGRGGSHAASKRFSPPTGTRALPNTRTYRAPLCRH